MPKASRSPGGTVPPRFAASAGDPTRSADPPPAAAACSTAPAPRNTRWLPAAAVFAATLAVYGVSLWYPWLAWDDRINVTENPGLHPVTWKSVAGFWLAAYERLYIPVAYTFLAGETLASGAIHGGEAWPPDPRFFHASSLLLHAVAGLLVLRLLGRIGVRDPAARLAGVAVFLLHPLQVESVAWISEQRGLLAGVFSLAALELAAPHPAAARPGRAAAALACYALAVLSKPQAIAVPLAAIVLDGRVGHEPPLLTARRYLAWGAVAVATLLTTTAAQPAAEMTDRPPPWLRPVVAGDALLHYAAAVVAPVGLAIDYGRTPRVVCADPGSFLRAAAAAIGLGMVAAVPAWRGARLATALWLIPLTPVLGFVPFVYQGISTVADRYAYLSLVGPAVAAGLAADLPGRLRPARRGVIAVCLLACALLTVAQVTTWRDSRALFTRALEVNPRSFIARRGLAGELAREGRQAEALAELDQAADLEARFGVPALSRYPRAVALHRLGRTDEAAREYLRAAEVERGNPRLHNDHGILLAQTGRVAEAAERFRTALRLRPAFAEAAANLRAAETILDRDAGRQQRLQAVD